VVAPPDHAVQIDDQPVEPGWHPMDSAVVIGRPLGSGPSGRTWQANRAGRCPRGEAGRLAPRAPPTRSAARPPRRAGPGLPSRPSAVRTGPSPTLRRAASPGRWSAEAPKDPDPGPRPTVRAR